MLLRGLDLSDDGDRGDICVCGSGEWRVKAWDGANEAWRTINKLRKYMILDSMVVRPVLFHKTRPPPLPRKLFGAHSAEKVVEKSFMCCCHKSPTQENEGIVYLS